MSYIRKVFRMPVEYFSNIKCFSYFIPLTFCQLHFFNLHKLMKFKSMYLSWNRNQSYEFNFYCKVADSVNKLACLIYFIVFVFAINANRKPLINYIWNKFCSFFEFIYLTDFIWKAAQSTLFKFKNNQSTILYFEMLQFFHRIANLK